MDDNVQVKAIPGVKDGDVLELRTRPMLVTAALLESFSDDFSKAVGKRQRVRERRGGGGDKKREEEEMKEGERRCGDERGIRKRGEEWKEEEERKGEERKRRERR